MCVCHSVCVFEGEERESIYTCIVCFKYKSICDMYNSFLAEVVRFSG